MRQCHVASKAGMAKHVAAASAVKPTPWLTLQDLDAMRAGAAGGGGAAAAVAARRVPARLAAAQDEQHYEDEDEGDTRGCARLDQGCRGWQGGAEA